MTKKAERDTSEDSRFTQTPPDLEWRAIEGSLDAEDYLAAFGDFGGPVAKIERLNAGMPRPSRRKKPRKPKPASLDLSDADNPLAAINFALDRLFGPTRS